MHIQRYEMELVRLGENIHPHHAVAFSDAATYRDAGKFVDYHRNAAHNRPRRIALAVWFTQRVAGWECLIAFATMLFQAGADGGVKFFVSVRVDQLFEVFQSQAGERNFLPDS